jgi:hypothetical protein
MISRKAHSFGAGVDGAFSAGTAFVGRLNAVPAVECRACGTARTDYRIRPWRLVAIMRTGVRAIVMVMKMVAVVVVIMLLRAVRRSVIAIVMIAAVIMIVIVIMVAVGMSGAVAVSRLAISVRTVRVAIIRLPIVVAVVVGDITSRTEEEDRGQHDDE